MGEGGLHRGVCLQGGGSASGGGYGWADGTHPTGMLSSYCYVLGMARNEISSLMSLLEAISVQFNDILHDINDKITRDFSIFCLTNSLKCFFFCTRHY